MKSSISLAIVTIAPCCVYAVPVALGWQVPHDATDGVERWEVGAVKDAATLCEGGACYFLDYHIALGGQTLESRTVFGNPPNNADGLSTGTFFLYDPTIDVAGEAITTGEAIATPRLFTISFMASGSVSEYSDAAMQQTILGVLAIVANLQEAPADQQNLVAPPGSTLSIRAGSVLLDASFPVLSAAAAAAAATAFEAAVTSPADLTAFFALVGLSITVETMPVTGSVEFLDSDDEFPVVLVAAIAGGVVGACILCACAAFFVVWSRSSKATGSKSLSAAI